MFGSFDHQSVCCADTDCVPIVVVAAEVMIEINPVVHSSSLDWDMRGDVEVLYCT